MVSTNKLFIIAGGLIGIAVIVLIISLLSGGFGPGKMTKADLEVWGVFDDPEWISATIEAFEKQYGGISVTYKSLNITNYEQAVIDALATGTGPDIWFIHNTWLPKHQAKLIPMPQNNKSLVYTLTNFRNDFVDVAVQDLIVDGNIYSMPLYVDTLALYYNKDLLNSAGISAPPQNWEEFNDDVKLLTKIDENGRFVQSGAAIGTARNINRSTDVLCLLMLQSGVPMVDEENGSAQLSAQVNDKDAGQIALQFYTDFANPTKSIYTWNDEQNYSIDAFSEGKTAMMFNYAHQISTIRAKAPWLNFSISEMPQIASTSTKVNYANYWAPVVTNNSEAPLQAWQFIKYLTSAEGATPYLNASLRPTARRDLIDAQKNEIDLGVFAEQALSARSWYQIDSGQIETILANTIDRINIEGESYGDALGEAEDRITVLMTKNE